MHRLLLLALLLPACRDRVPTPPPNSATPTTPTVRFDTPRGPWLVRVEVVNTDESRARGLMFRKSLDPDSGMLFVFDETADHSFWMRNTLISLDLIFLDDARTVVGVIPNAEPKSEVSRSIGKPSRYVVEVAGGEASAHAVGPGTRAAFIGVQE